MLADQLIQKGHEVTKMETPHIPIKNLKKSKFCNIWDNQRLTKPRKI
ncbi:hypothetical protein BG20_I0108 [Candidatus Nitrosarchaeum limnium BG20]|uniref:Uncharacterized protein n=2 Tax=Nitrosarchaeum TaxID=1007082 RepID=S2E3E1_9ARCH|nr:hypothetical protein BG20_I0108 [Candidatus Nitrosarchaeum limnium BG20]